MSHSFSCGLTPAHFEVPLPLFNHTDFIPADDLSRPLADWFTVAPSAATTCGDIISGLLAARPDKQKAFPIYRHRYHGDVVLGDENLLIAGAGAVGLRWRRVSARKGMKADRAPSTM